MQVADRGNDAVLMLESSGSNLRRTCHILFRTTTLTSIKSQNI